MLSWVVGGGRHLRRVRLSPAVPLWRGRGLVLVGVETSCDDTAVAVVRMGEVDHRLRSPSSAGGALTDAADVIAAETAAQHHIHAKHAGVVPALARFAHAAALPRVWSSVMQAAGAAGSEVDVLGVTVGPGLAPCLQEGVAWVMKAAPQLARPPRWLVLVNHLEAHLLSPRLYTAQAVTGASSSSCTTAFPYLALLVSGGHTLLVLVRGVGWYERMGGTMDDSVGECFDKAARALQVWRWLPHDGVGDSGTVAASHPSGRGTAAASPAAAVHATPQLAPNSTSTPNHFATSPGADMPGAHHSSHLGALLERLAALAPDNAHTPEFPVPLRGNRAAAGGSGGGRGALPIAFSLAGLKSSLARWVDAQGG